MIRLDEEMVYIMEYYLAVKKNSICCNMNEPKEYYPWWNKPERERQILYDITYMWHLKNNANESIGRTEVERYRKQNCGSQREEGRGQWQTRSGRLTDINRKYKRDEQQRYPI